MKPRGKIGIFDSGIGGLTTLATLQHALPQYEYVYLGDTAHAPYGTKNQTEIYTLTRHAVTWLRANGCVLIIIACNTASAEALKRLQAELVDERDSFRILGVLTPLVENALEVSRDKKIAVLATPATIASGAYEREIKKREPEAHVVSVPCPLLVPCIESGATDSPQCQMALDEYCDSALRHDVDTVVLGCTHYGHIVSSIRARIPKTCAIVYEEACIAPKTAAYLLRHTAITAQLSLEGGVSVYATQLHEQFKKRALDLLNPAPQVLAEVATMTQ